MEAAGRVPRPTGREFPRPTHNSPTHRLRAMSCLLTGPPAAEHEKPMSTLLAKDTSAGRRRGGAKVLVAEDHEDTRCLLRTILEKRGLVVFEAQDGEEAVRLAERELPDLILMDGSLPLLDGFAATRRLRLLDTLSGVPIVFLSGHAGAQHVLEARDAGCDDYVIKPFDLA